MFDPSKINLDLEGNEGENTPEESKKQEETIINEQDNIDSLENKELETKIENKEENQNQEEKENEVLIDNIDEEKVEEKKENLDVFEEKEVNETEQNQNQKQEEDEEIKKENRTPNENESSNQNQSPIQDKIEEKEEEKIIFDININSLDYLMKYLVSKEYDFFVLEPEEDKIKVSFRKDNLEKELKYIKYPTYTNILLKAKSLTKLKIEETNISQEWTAEVSMNKKVYKALSKTAPSTSWEKLFFKMASTEKKAETKKKKGMSFGKMMSIFWGLFFTAILIWWVFISIVLFNSNSISDLQFFNNLWVNTNAIKDFAAKVVNWVFGMILVVEIIILFIFSYKALLTKKDFKKDKITRIIISMFFLVLSVITFITWMFLAQKINSLKGLNYWKVEFYDNSKYLSELFWEQWSKINISEKIIWPINIRFNNKEFIQKLVDDWFSPQSVTWVIWKTKKEVAVEDYETTYEFREKWLTDVNLVISGTNIKWEIEEIEKNIWKINISNTVKIEEIKLDNGWSKFVFDASDLRSLWKVKWYYIPSLEWKTDDEINNIVAKSLSKEKLEWYKFNSKNIFEWEEYYWIKIVNSSWEPEELDKLFIISKWDKNEVSWEIESINDPNDDKKYSFVFKNPETNIWEAYISKYVWRIQDFGDSGEENYVVIEKDANLSNLENSSKISYTFKKQWIHNVVLDIIDSDWKTQTFTDKIEIKKSLDLLTKLSFKVDNRELKYGEDIIYERENNTYYLENILAPSSIEIDANKIRTTSWRYGLKTVEFDLDSDWSFETIERKTKYDLIKGWIKSFKVKYKFVNKNIQEEIIDIVETIHITWTDREAILDLKIIKPSSYVPVIVKFDASNSKVNWKDIEKFIFDYGDWTEPEERDSINSWRRYVEAWEYDIKLSVVTSDWSKYDLKKKLILRNKPQKAVISTSLKKAPVYQTIDFSAEKSIWEVWSYFWDFWDGSTSTKMSHSHSYDKAWKYSIKLEIEFSNKNILKDEIEMEIYED